MICSNCYQEYDTGLDKEFCSQKCKDECLALTKEEHDSKCLNCGMKINGNDVVVYAAKLFCCQECMDEHWNVIYEDREEQERRYLHGDY